MQKRFHSVTPGIKCSRQRKEAVTHAYRGEDIDMFQLIRILDDLEKNDQSQANNLTYAGGRSCLKGGLCTRLC